ncbi:hypothetical protein Tco_1369774 [Tanacetum coccineum]
MQSMVVMRRPTNSCKKSPSKLKHMDRKSFAGRIVIKTSHISKRKQDRLRKRVTQKEPYVYPILTGFTVLSDDEEIAEDSSKQGRKISQINEDLTISLVQDEGISWIPQEEEVHEKPNDETEVIVQEETPTKIIEEHGSGEKGEMEISTASPPKVAKVSTAEAHVYTRRSAKDKGKAIMEEPATPKKVKKRTQVQLRSEVEKDSSKPSERETSKTVEEEKVEEEDVKPEPVLIEKKAVGIRGGGKKEKETADYEEEKDELRMWLTVVPDEEEFVDPKILHTRFPIVDWESQVYTVLHVYRL